MRKRTETRKIVHNRGHNQILLTKVICNNIRSSGLVRSAGDEEEIRQITQRGRPATPRQRGVPSQESSTLTTTPFPPRTTHVPQAVPSRHLNSHSGVLETRRRPLLANMTLTQMSMKAKAKGLLGVQGRHPRWNKQFMNSRQMRGTLA